MNFTERLEVLLTEARRKGEQKRVDCKCEDDELGFGPMSRRWP